MLTAVISLLFWLVVIPFCIGLIPVNFITPRRRTPGLLFLAGYFCMWALFALAAIPAVLWVEYDILRWRPRYLRYCRFSAPFVEYFCGIGTGHPVVRVFWVQSQEVTLVS
ncbi:MAG: hypothetical protein K2N37_00885 [Lachnospiraceae bacterium]|nr:hypothetical protein [Lachnospiraceae bacterium]